MMSTSRFQNFPVSFWLPRILWSIVACGVLAVGILLFTLTVLSDTRWVKESLISVLEGTAGGPIQIETLNLNLFPSPEIHVSGLWFETHYPDFVVFRVNQLEVGIGWQSLWDKSLFINWAVIDQPELTLGVPLVSKSEEPTTVQFPSIGDIAIRNGRLHLIKTSHSAQNMTLDWEAIQLSIMKLEAEKSARIQLSAQIPDPQPPSALTLNGTMTFLDNDDTSSDQQEHSGIPAMAIQGQIDVTQFHLGHLVQFLRGHELEAPIYTEANLQGNFSYTFLNEQDLLNFQSFQVSLDEWSFAGQGSIENILHESPWLKVSGTTQPVAIQRIPDLLPPDWLPSQLRTVLKEHHMAGTMELQSGSLSGPLDGNGSWETNGTVALNNGQFLPAIGQPLITNVSASVTLAPPFVHMAQVQGTIAPLRISVPEATLALEGETVQLSIPAFQVSEKDWNLHGTAAFADTHNEPPVLTVSVSALPISIQRLSNILPEVWRPTAVHTTLAERDIDGEMELLTGSVKWTGDDATPLVAEGVVRVANGHVLVDPHHPSLTHLSGEVVFGSNLVRIFNVKGIMEASKVLVNEATLEWKDAGLWVDLQAKGLFSAKDVHQALLRDPRIRPLVEPLTLYHDVQGNMGLSARVSGPLTHPSELHIHDGNLVLGDMHLSTSEDRLPLTQVTGHLWFDDQQIQIHRFNGMIGKSPVNIKGRWPFRKDSKGVNLTMRNVWSSVDLQTLLPSVVQIFPTFEGVIGNTLTLSGSNLRPDYHADFDLTDIAIGNKGVFHKPLGVQATIGIQGTIQGEKAIRLTKGEVSIPPFQLETEGEMSWSNPPYFRGTLQTQSGTGSRFPPEVVIGDKSLNLTGLTAKWGLEGRAWDWTTWSMKGTVESTNHTSRSMASTTNQAAQSLGLQWWQHNQAGKGNITIKDIPIESLMVSQANTPSPLTGMASLVSSIRFSLGSPEVVLNSLTGKGHAQLRKGLIQTGPILSKVLGILNVPSVLMGQVDLLEEGLPFDRLEGSFSIENGLLSTQDLALKSPVIKLTAAGNYDLPTEILDGMIAVSPFGAYSTLLKDIPLFGSLMKGERKGLLTALFEVKGSRTKPDITYLPLESVTGGLQGFAQFAVDVLENVVTLPLPDKKAQSSDSPSKQ